MSLSKYSAVKAFVFSVEALIALVLFMSFMQIAHFDKGSSGVVQELALRNAVGDSLAYLENSGFAQQQLDSNLADGPKMDSIYSEVSSMLPAGSNFHLEITSYDTNSDNCEKTKTFSGCFFNRSSLPSKGDAVPSAKTVAHGRVVLISNAAPQACIQDTSFSFEEQKKLYQKLLFAGERADRVFFDAPPLPDINVYTGTNVTPFGSASCDQNIRVDLNAWIDYNSLNYGRSPADIMLVLDKSGSMSWDGDMNGLTSPQDLFVSGNYLYIADGTAGLRDVNILDPSKPNIVGTYNSPGAANGVAVSGNTAYIADDTFGLNIVNVTAKTAPASLGSITTIGTASKVDVSGNYAYVVTTTSGSDVLDFTTTSTQNVDLLLGNSTSPNSWAGQSFVPASTSISSVGVYLKRTSSRPNSDLVVHLRQTLQGADIASGTISNQSVTTNYAWYTATFASPATVSTSQTYYIVLTTASSSSSRYYYWGGNNTNPYSNGSAYTQTTNLPATDAMARLYHPFSLAGLLVIDVSNPASPAYRAEIPGSDPQDVFVLGNYAYFADGSAGLKVVDISNPLSPVLRGSVATTSAGGLFASSGMIYLADGSAGLRDINVADPSNPQIIGTYPGAGTATDAFLYSDGNVYVANSSSLLSVNVSPPNSPGLSKSFATPYSAYSRVQVSNNWAFILSGNANDLVALNIYNGPKINQLQVSADQFVDYNGWKSAYDQLGEVNFNGTAALDQTLLKATDTNRAIIKQKIGALIASGSTAMGDAITSAKNELTSSRATKGSFRFEVLLTDGVSNTGSSPCCTATSAAQGAKDNNIKIYTIGFGPDADTATLQNIANLTGGKYYSASDQNALSDVFNYIAIDIGESLNGSYRVDINNSSIRIPVSNCSDIVDQNTGICHIVDGQNYLDYNVGDVNRTNPWNGSFTLNIPCDSTEACGISSLTLPFAGSTFYYDYNGSNYSRRWDANQTISFKYRDLALVLNNAQVFSKNWIDINLTAQNVGLLSSADTNVDFFLNTPTGIPIASEYVGPLNPGGIMPVFKAINQTGTIYAIINSSKAIRECPGNDGVKISCNGSPAAKVFVVDVWSWLG